MIIHHDDYSRSVKNLHRPSLLSDAYSFRWLKHYSELSRKVNALPRIISYAMHAGVASCRDLHVVIFPQTQTFSSPKTMESFSGSAGFEKRRICHSSLQELAFVPRRKRSTLASAANMYFYSNPLARGPSRSAGFNTRLRKPLVQADHSVELLKTEGVRVSHPVRLRLQTHIASARR